MKILLFLYLNKISLQIKTSLMKKTIFTLFTLLLLSAGAFSQMSFQPVKLKKSSFDFTDNQKNLISHDDNTSTILISDEDNDITKKRKKQR